jgi:hypothetical protein
MPDHWINVKPSERVAIEYTTDASLLPTPHAPQTTQGTPEVTGVSTSSSIRFESDDGDEDNSPPYSRAPSPPPTPNSLKRGRFYVPVCLDQSDHLCHSEVIISSNQSEDDNKTFARLQGVYRKSTGWVRTLFYGVAKIHRAKVYLSN